jgi:photosystem II stability/assembly factor-like uncharacterized protein
MLAAMVLLRVFAKPVQPTSSRKYSGQAIVLTWICLLAFVVVLSLLVAKLALTLFPKEAGNATVTTVPLTIKVVERGTFAPTVATILTVKTDDGNYVRQELIPGPDGVAKLDLAPGKYRLAAIGAAGNLQFEVSPPATTITIQVDRSTSPELVSRTVDAPVTPEVRASVPPSETPPAPLKWELLRAAPPEVTALARLGSMLFTASKKDILRSSDGGKTWNDSTSFDRNVNQLVSCGEQIAAAEIVKPDDYKVPIFLSQNGSSWRKTQILPDPGAPYALGCQGKTIVAGDAQGIFVSKDNGTTWDKTSLELAPRAIVAYDAGFDAVGDIFHTPGYCNGQNQKCGRMPNTGALISLARSPTGVIYAGSADGSIQVSFNGGRGFTTHMVSKGDPVKAILVVPGLVMVGGDAGVFRSTDEGTTWTPLSGAPTYVTSLAEDGSYLYAGFTGRASGIARSGMAPHRDK